MVPLQPELAQLLRPLQQSAGFIIARENDRQGNHNQQFNKFLKRQGLARSGRSPHSTRHTWISLLLAMDINALQVASWAGHQTLSTTQGYSRSQERYRDQVATWPKGVLRLATQHSAIVTEDDIQPS